MKKILLLSAISILASACASDGENLCNVLAECDTLNESEFEDCIDDAKDYDEAIGDAPSDCNDFVAANDEFNDCLFGNLECVDGETQGEGPPDDPECARAAQNAETAFENSSEECQDYLNENVF